MGDKIASSLTSFPLAMTTRRHCERSEAFLICHSGTKRMIVSEVIESDSSAVILEEASRTSDW